MKFRSPLGNKLWEQVFIYLFLGLFLLLIGIKAARSEESTFRVEAGAAFVRGETSAINLAITWPDAGPYDTGYMCGMGLIGASTFRSVVQANQAAVFCNLFVEYKRLYIGIGPALLQNTDEYNGSHFNFHPTLGWRFNEHWLATYRHFSNAGTKKPNKGRDLLYVSYEF